MEVCRGYNKRATKTIRVTMEEIDMILERNKRCSDRLKVIHLIRDPRGKANSHLHLPEGNELNQGIEGVKGQVKRFCPRIMKDIQLRQKLEAQYPHSFLELIYEKTADNFLEYTEKVYDFAWNEKPPPEIYRWVERVMLGTKQNFDPFNTRRTNASQTARLWKTQLSLEMLKHVESNCLPLITYLQQDFITTEKNLWSRILCLPCPPCRRVSFPRSFEMEKNRSILSWIFFLNHSRAD